LRRHAELFHLSARTKLAEQLHLVKENKGSAETLKLAIEARQAEEPAG
jgi:hypothetical protein